MDPPPQYMSGKLYQYFVVNAFFWRRFAIFLVDLCPCNVVSKYNELLSCVHFVFSMFLRGENLILLCDFVETKARII